jgi:hypothetical protein
MKTFEPKQLFTRYGAPLGRFENTVTDDELGSVEPAGCCADRKEKCSHASIDAAHFSKIQYDSAVSYRVPEREWIPTALPCDVPACAESGNYQIVYATRKVTLCTNHCNQEGVRSYALASAKMETTGSKLQ